MATGTERFPVIESPQRLPGSCLACSGSKGPFIDTGIQKPALGHVYLCSNCILEMARMLGVPATVEVPDPNSITKEEYEATVNGLRDSLIGSVNSLLSALSDRPVSILPAANEEVVPELHSGDEGTVPSTDRTTEENDESVSIEGPVSVPGDRSDGDSEENLFD